MEIFYIINEDNITIKDYLKKINFSKRLSRYVKMNGSFYINGVEAKNYYLLNKGDKLILKFPIVNNDNIKPEFKNLDIVYEDEYMLIINKEANMVTHPSARYQENTLANYIKGYFLKNKINASIHFINRLDAQTSGLILIAKNRYIHFLLSDDLINIKRKYIARCYGIIKEDSGIINKSIAKEAAPSIKRYVSNNGKEAITRYRVLKRNDDSTILRISLETGRTHQIRVHFSSINHSIIGDKLYGNGGDLLYLHSYFLEFTHPITKDIISITKYPLWYKEEEDA